MKNIILCILIIIGISLFYDNENEVENKYIEISHNNKDSSSNKLLLYFSQKEIEIIENAAKRNNCSGENLIILYSVYKSERGSPGNEFGIKCPKHINTNLDGQAACAAVTIINNRERWERVGKPGDFISFLGNVYCPTSGKLSIREKELNKNWIPNVEYWVNKLSY